MNSVLQSFGGVTLVPPVRRRARAADYLVWRGRVAATCALVLALAGCGGGASDGSTATSAADTANGTGRVATLSAGSTADGAAAGSTTTWTPCASEGQSCTFSGTKLVRYGSGTTFTVLTFSDGTACSNGVFGDPTPNVVKTCAITDTTSPPAFDPSNWTLCASEGGSCSFGGTRQVRYGTTSQGVTLQASGGTACTNSVFGDPAYGVAKSCWVANTVGAATTETWTACAQENQTCSFSGTRAVRYGAGNATVSATFTAGVVCSNASFGDPAWGVVKSCMVSSIDTSAGAQAVSALSVPALTAAVLGTPSQLAATVNPTAAAVVWTITDATVASIDAAGVVTPLRPGYTTFTATAGGKSASGTLTVRGPTPIPVRSQSVGTNVAGLAYYGSNFPFSDLMKTSGGWGSNDGTPFAATAADGTPAALKPGQVAGTPVAWDYSRYPAGRYTVLWDGEGTISFPHSRVNIVERTANRIVLVPTDTTSQMWIGIDATNPANPIRNVRFLLPGTEATAAAQRFNPDYLQKLAPFSMLRFMDWGATNGSSVVEWADRAKPDAAAFTGSNGVPIEAMIDLANTLHVDPWFCIPHKASDDYVRQFAKLVHDRLDPTLRPRVEYSNEVWNTGFSQNGWASQQSDAQGLSRPWGMPSQFYAKRSVQIFKIMQAVYGSADAHRLVRVLAGQAAWTQFLKDALAYADTAANVDVLAVAPYFQADAAGNTANVDSTLRLTSDQVVDQMFASVRGQVKSWMSANGALAAQNRLKLEAYESGPTDTAWAFPADKQDAVLALFKSANYNPRMKDLYVEYYAQWKAAGGDTMNQYVDVNAWSKWGLWGALESTYQDVATSPKYQGLLAVIAADPFAPPQTTLRSARGD